MLYDALLFCEIIESIQGIQFLRDEVRGDVKVRVYQGLKGIAVFIDISYEDITHVEGKGYLEDLGIGYLIKSLFPDETPKVEVVKKESNSS